MKLSEFARDTEIIDEENSDCLTNENKSMQYSPKSIKKLLSTKRIS